MPTDVRKAAILLLSLQPAHMARLLARLERQHVLALADEIAQIESLEPAEQRAAWRAFQVVGLAESAKRPDARDHARLDSLRDVRPSILWKILADEHPQTVALVLAHLPAATAAVVLAALPNARQAEVARRLVAIDRVSPASIEELARTIEQRAIQLSQYRSIPIGGPSRLAKILSAAKPTLTASILDRLAVADPQSARAVRALVVLPAPALRSEAA